MLEDSDFELEVLRTNKVGGDIEVRLEVFNDGEQEGQFTVVYEGTGDGDYIADWSTTKDGSGIYTDAEPPFWMIEQVTEHEIKSTFPDAELVVIDSDRDYR